MKHVIIGAGPAGVIAAEALRKLDQAAAITIVGDEPEPPYSRMAIPYYLMENIDEAGTYLRKSQGHFDAHNIEIKQGRVVGVNTAQKSLALDGGGTVDYDKLLVATGSEPVRPPIPGMELAGVNSCWTLEDARKILTTAQAGSTVVLIGAGFIGCIILEALASRGVNLIVVEMDDRMVPRMMDQNSGNLIKAWCQDRGVTVHTSTRVVSINEAGERFDVALDNGEAIKADMVISATGVKPKIDFLEDSGIQSEFGVMVNDRLQSSDAHVYAAGDVCQGKDFSTGGYSVQAIQPTAADHGRIAAMNMAGRDTVHQGGINLNVLDTMGLIASSYGSWMGVPGGDHASLCDRDRYRYIALQFEDDVLVGAQSLGLTQHVGVLRGLIQSRLKLGKWKDHLLKDPTRIMEAYLGSTQALGHNAGVI